MDSMPLLSTKDSDINDELENFINNIQKLKTKQLMKFGISVNRNSFDKNDIEALSKLLAENLTSFKIDIGYQLNSEVQLAPVLSKINNMKELVKLKLAIGEIGLSEQFRDEFNVPRIK